MKIKSIILGLIISTMGHAQTNGIIEDLNCSDNSGIEKRVRIVKDTPINALGDNLPLVEMAFVSDVDSPTFFDILMPGEFIYHHGQSVFVNLKTNTSYLCTRNLDRPLPAVEVISGQLMSVFGIGGETTGLAVSTENGLIEVAGINADVRRELDAHLEQNVRLKGRRGTAHGVERGEYPVFYVTEILK